MTKTELEILKDKVGQLEEELEARHNDLAVYREELIKANKGLEEMIGQVQSQLHWAAKIQQKLVPTEFPNISGFDFSTKFLASPKSGGDYFDIFEHRDKMRFGMMLSSASGYGMSALFLSVLLKLSMDIEGKQSRKPQLVLEEIAKNMADEGTSGDFAHVFYAVVDRRTYEVSYCLAGDIVALHYDRSKDQLTQLKGDAEPIKMGEVSSYSANVLALNPKDKLIFCSPGFLKVSNIEEEPFGFDQLLATVKKGLKSDVHELRNDMFFRAEQFAQGVEYPKDLTALVIEVKDRVIKLASKS